MDHAADHLHPVPGIAGTDLEQFKDWSRQVVVYPREYKSGNLLYPFEKARK